MRGIKKNGPGLAHPGQEAKQEQAIQIQPVTHATAGATGGWVQDREPPDWAVWEGKQEAQGWGIQNGAERHAGGPLDWSIRGQQAHSPGSSAAEHEGGANKMPTPEPRSGAQGWRT